MSVSEELTLGQPQQAPRSSSILPSLPGLSFERDPRLHVCLHALSEDGGTKQQLRLGQLRQGATADATARGVQCLHLMACRGYEPMAIIAPSSVLVPLVSASVLLAGCVATSDEQIVLGGSFGTDAVVVGSFSGGASKGAVIGGVASPQPALASTYPSGYGGYDYRSHSYGGYDFSTQCVRWDLYSGHCVVWRRY